MRRAVSNIGTTGDISGWKRNSMPESNQASLSTVLSWGNINRLLSTTPQTEMYVETHASALVDTCMMMIKCCTSVTTVWYFGNILQKWLSFKIMKSKSMVISKKNITGNCETKTEGGCSTKSINAFINLGVITTQDERSVTRIKSRISQGKKAAFQRMNISCVKRHFRWVSKTGLRVVVRGRVGTDWAVSPVIHRISNPS